MTPYFKLITEMQTWLPDNAHRQDNRRLRVAVALLTGVVLGLATGCGTRTTRVKSKQPVAIVPPAPVVKVETPPPPTPVPEPPPSAQVTPPAPAPVTPPVEPEPPVPTGEYGVWVESEPTAAMIVVNGIPVGRTPKRVNLPVSALGFARDTVSIKVRFIAENIGLQSQTVEAVLTPLDRMPSNLVFTPSKVHRKQ